MDKEFGAPDYWRKYFRSAKSDIFEVIKYAIIVAAWDCPKEFRIERDRIAETLFSCRLTRCLGCDHVELAIAKEEEDGGGVSKESKVTSSTDDHLNLNMSNYSYDEAEALTEEIEEENQIVGEVLRIKGVIANSHDQSDGILFDSLRKLQLMALSVETLKATEIGKGVNRLSKHASKDIRHLARTLIEGWMDIVDEWADATATIAGAEGTPDSVNPSVVDEEEGLPSPPLDEGAFFATQTTSIELSQFFDGMDDDGNPRHSGEFNKNRDKGRRPSRENHNIPKWKQLPLHDANVLIDNNDRQVKKQEAIIKQSKPSNANSGPGRPLKVSSEHKVDNETKLKLSNYTIQKKPVVGHRDKSKCSDEVQEKLEASKRKLQEGYQQAENAKKQRTIQVMELHDLPKQGFGHRNTHFKPGNHNRRWNGRH